ncbi:MAG: glutamate ligase domain-containing protein, partial [Spirochaetia bacterium]
SRRQPSAGIAGIHGKTTTTALSGVLVKALRLPGSVLVPTSVPDFDGETGYAGGRQFFITETCEYRRNFLNFSPQWVVFTSLELDHPDYFKSIDDVEDAFLSYLKNIQRNGSLIFYADSDAVKRCVGRLHASRPDISLVPYGKTAEGPFRIFTEKSTPGWNHFRLRGLDKVFRLSIPGEHLILDAAAALALTVEISNHLKLDYRPRLSGAVKALENFRGTKRRSEFIGHEGGILFFDDYGHHPTAISTTIKGFKTFYPDRRIVVDFMAHTYTRTRTLLDDFATAFTDADALILHRIYGSARENGADPALDGMLYEVIRNNRQEVYYLPDINDADSFLADYLRPGDLFLTLGAGDNWKIGLRLMKKFTGENR